MYVHLLVCYLNKVQNVRCNDKVRHDEVYSHFPQFCERAKNNLSVYKPFVYILYCLSSY